jgi:hypothetical protein
VGHLVVREVNDSALLEHECLELLLVVRDTGRERRQTPVNVAVSLLAPETQHIQALGRNDAADRLPYAMDDRLQSEIFV